MKHFFFVTAICITIVNCNSKSTNPVAGKEYFTYDTIIHYVNDIDESMVGELYDKKTSSNLDALRFGVLLGDVPKSIADLKFINALESIGYKEKIVEKEKFDAIGNIFMEKPPGEVLSTSCIPIYRDLLLFKRKAKFVGIAKVCFECWSSVIYGTSADTYGFGQDGDYRRLENLLRQ